MLPQRVYRVFLRYAVQNLALEQHGGELRNADGDLIGRLDAVKLYQNRMIVTGQSRASRIGVQHDVRRHWVRPDTAKCSFVLDVPFEPGPLKILAEVDGQEVAHLFDGFSPQRIALARLALMPQFAASLIRLIPQIWRWKRAGDLGARETIKEALGLVPRSHAAELEADDVRAVPDRRLLADRVPGPLRRRAAIVGHAK